MPLRTLSLQPVLAGIIRRTSLQNQAPFSTPDALNCWGTDSSAGQNARDRIATRPGLTSTGGNITEPYNWCEATWLNSGLKRGIAVVASGGVYTTVDGGSWTEYLTTAPGTDFASCWVYLQKLYMARGGGTTLFVDLTGAAGAGAVITPTAGTVPTNCGLVIAHQDRLWLGGDTANPHVLYAARTGVPTDWDYAGTNGDANAWASNVAPGGAIGEPLTALIPHTEDCLVIGCTDSMMVIRGNPQQSGPVRVSHYVGPLMQSAWTHDGNGNLWFMSRDGLYRMPAGCGDGTISISREALPDDLVALNPGTAGTYCSVSYDPRFRCLWIFVDTSSTDQFWSFDLQAPNGAWWKHTFAAGPLRLGATLKGASTADESAVLALNASGTVYQFDRDSTESFSSHCVYGPIQLGSAGLEGILHAVQASVATDSDAVSWTVHVSGTAEGAVARAIAGTADFTGADWSESLSTWQHPARRGAYACIRVGGTTTDRWSLENIDCQLRQLGLRRAS